MPAPRPVVQHSLTEAQVRLLDRHERGLRSVASELANRNGLAPKDIVFILADRKGRIGRALGAAVSVSAIGPVVLPGRAAELQAWIQRLAVQGPVWDCTATDDGIAAIVIDHDDAMALCRVPFE
jgi:hypothetical protein